MLPNSKNEEGVKISSFGHIIKHISKCLYLVKVNIGGFSKIINCIIHGQGIGARVRGGGLYFS